MTRRALITPLALAAAVAGCGGSSDGNGHNKAGATSARAQTIVLQATDPSTPEAQQFAKQVSKRSGGSLTVEMRRDYSSNTPANEAELARDLRSGQADFGMLPTKLDSGRFEAARRPRVANDRPFTGTVTLDGDVARFRALDPGGNHASWTARWSYYNGELTWVPVDLNDLETRMMLGAHPWKKVG